MSKFQRSWLLMKSSLSVIGGNKSLLVFPVVTFACTVTIITFFLAPPLLRPTGYPYLSGEHWQAISHSLFNNSGPNGQAGLTPGAMVYTGFLYFLSMFIATFCNVAFYHEILAALAGQPVSVARGLKFAFGKIWSVLMWSIFAGLIGLIIRIIEERLELVGRIVGRLLGLAWSIAAVFVIPVIVTEEQNSNPFTLLRKSAEMLKRTWGEALIGYAGLAFANTLIVLGSVVWLVGSVMVSVAVHNYWIIALSGFGWLVAICAWSYVVGVASNVYRGALYLYAAEGTVPAPYTQEMMDSAWKFKKS